MNSASNPLRRDGRRRSAHRITAALALSAAALGVSACHHDGLPIAGDPTVLGLDGKQDAWATVALPDGRILVAGESDLPYLHVLLARFLANGSVDTTFGTAGVVVTDVAPSKPGTQGIGYALARQPDGKILVGGHAWPTGSTAQMMVARYSSEGVLDTTFGGGGTGIIAFDVNPTGSQVVGESSSDEVFGLAVQADGKILVGGSAAIHHALSGSYWSDCALARLNADGTRDLAFGTGGATLFSVGNSCYLRSLAALDGGGVLAGGFGAPPPNEYSVLLARYTASGQLDPSFGDQGAGYQITDFGGDDRAYGLSVLASGKYLVAGQTTVAKTAAFLIARFTADGKLDPMFAKQGFRIDEFPAGAAVGRGLVVDSANYWVGGFALGAEGNYDFALARYSSDGSLDNCAGGTGLVTVPIAPGTDDHAYGIVLQPDGTPVLAGQSGDHIAIDRLDRLECPTGLVVH